MPALYVFHFAQVLVLVLIMVSCRDNGHNDLHPGSAVPYHSTV